jgi:hypothetical protein
MPIEITRAAPERLADLASVFGRAFVSEPMMTWPLGEGADIEGRLVRAFDFFLEELIELGMVWEETAGLGFGLRSAGDPGSLSRVRDP